jgi:hypothetical protein
MGALRLEPKKKAKVMGYYEQLEAGALNATRVDGRVWDVLADMLNVRARDLLTSGPSTVHFLGAPSAARSRPMMAATRAFEAAEEPEDEIDRLFQGAKTPP